MNKPWPYKSVQELREAGYVFVKLGHCREESCGDAISWWKTPDEKFMPLDATTLEPHWTSCKKPKRFRKYKAGKPVKQAGGKR